MRRPWVVVLAVLLLGAVWWLVSADDEAEPSAPLLASSSASDETHARPELPSTESAREWERTVPPAGDGETAPTPPLLDEPTEQDGAFEVTVLRGGQPVAGVALRVYLRGPRDPNTGETLWRVAGTAASHPDGTARILARPGAYLVTARLGGVVAARAEAVRPTGESVTRVALTLAPATAVRGLVVERSSGAPVPTATVTMSWLAEGAWRAAAPDDEKLYATADPRGAFAFADVAPGTYLVEASAVGYGRAHAQRLKVPMTAPLKLELGGAGTLTGYVVHADGKPAADAEVQVTGGEDPVVVRSGPGGGFSAEVEPGAHAIAARSGSESGAIERAIARAGQTTDVGVLRLSAGAVFEGVVRAKSGGAPIANAMVAVSPFNANGDTARAFSGADGRFRIDGLPPGSHDVVVSASGYTALVRKGVTVGSGQSFPLELLLDGTGEAAGTVKDPEGAPLANVRVRGGRTFGGFAGVQQAETVTDGQGRYHLGGLEVGTTSIEALSPDGSVGDARQARIRDGETTELNLQLAATGTLTGRVTRPDGTPEPGAQVFTMGVGAMGRNRSLEAGADGRFSATVPAGRYRIAAKRPADRGIADDAIKQATVKAGETAEVELQVPDPVRRDAFASGTVYEPWGTPASNAFVYVTLGGAAQFRYGALAGDDGQFEIPAESSLAEVKTFDLQAVNEGRRGAVTGIRPGSNGVRIELVAGGSIAGTLVATPMPPSHRVAVSAGFAYVEQLPREYRGEHFDVPDVPPGEVTLVVSTDDGRRAERKVTVASGQRTAVTVTLAAAATIRAILIDAVTRAPLEQASAINHATGEVADADEGVVEFTGLAAGTYDLMFIAAGHEVNKQKVTVAEGQQLDLGQIALAPRDAGQ